MTSPRLLSQHSSSLLWFWPFDLPVMSRLSGLSVSSVLSTAIPAGLRLSYKQLFTNQGKLRDRSSHVVLWHKQKHYNLARPVQPSTCTFNNAPAFKEHRHTRERVSRAHWDHWLWAKSTLLSGPFAPIVYRANEPLSPRTDFNCYLSELATWQSAPCVFCWHRHNCK